MVRDRRILRTKELGENRGLKRNILMNKGRYCSFRKYYMNACGVEAYCSSLKDDKILQT